MSDLVHIQDISGGYREIREGSSYNKFFGNAEDRDRVILDNGSVFETVDLMKRVVWKYIDDTKLIAQHLQLNTLEKTCENIWNFLYNHIQYRLDKQGVEQLRRPNRSWPCVDGFKCVVYSGITRRRSVYDSAMPAICPRCID